MSLKEELRASQVAHMDLSRFCQVSPGTPVREAIEQMRQDGIDVCLVVDDGRLAGIFTGRDALMKVAPDPETWDRPIEELMTPEPLTIGVDASAADGLWLMSEKNVRDLPAVSADGQVLGTMTYRTIIEYLAARYPTEILNLPPRPDRFPDRSEGG